MLELVATDSSNTTQATSATFNVAPLSVPVLASPDHDGVCDDSRYVDATRLPLSHSGITGQSEGTVLLGRDNTDLVVCMQDLLRLNSFSGTPSYVRVSLDADNSRDSQTQADDYFVSV